MNKRSPSAQSGQTRRDENECAVVPRWRPPAAFSSHFHIQIHIQISFDSVDFCTQRALSLFLSRCLPAPCLPVEIARTRLLVCLSCRPLDLRTRE